MANAPNEWTAFFDEHAPAYDDNCFTKNTLREVDFLIETLGLAPGASILDVGCGTGRHAVELARRGYAVTGVDISAGMLAQAAKRAREAGVAVAFHRADATRFLPDRRYDAAICLCEGAFGLLGGGDDALAQPLAILGAVAAALGPGGPCLFTVLNGLAMIRKHAPADLRAGRFDPSALAEKSECVAPGVSGPRLLRERAFVPTELILLFAVAGLEVLGLWGGTAGNWGRRPVELDEMEIMVHARKARDPAASPAEILARRASGKEGGHA